MALTTLALIRHAKAGDRELWEGSDEIRPLTASGRRQARAITGIVAPLAPARIVSSPLARCVQTVEPLAATLGLDLETDAALAEGATLEDALGLVRVAHGRSLALCSHGDVLVSILDHLAAQHVPSMDASLCHKGSVWILESDGERFVSAAYNRS